MERGQEGDRGIDEEMALRYRGPNIPRRSCMMAGRGLIQGFPGFEAPSFQLPAPISQFPIPNALFPLDSFQSPSLGCYYELSRSSPHGPFRMCWPLEKGKGGCTQYPFSLTSTGNASSESSAPLLLPSISLVSEFHTKSGAPVGCHFILRVCLYHPTSPDCA